MDLRIGSYTQNKRLHKHLRCNVRKFFSSPELQEKFEKCQDFARPTRPPS